MRRVLLFFVLCPGIFAAAQSEPSAIQTLVQEADKEGVVSSRFSDGYVGLYPENRFDLTTGRCATCQAPTEGKWYFLDDIIAVPKSGKPSLVWIGSHDMIEGAALSKDGQSIRLKDGSSVPLALVPKIPSNRSYYDGTTADFFRHRTLRLRGEFVDDHGTRRFLARTIWPEDYRVDFGSLPSVPVRKRGDVTKLIKQDVVPGEPFSARLLWERAGAARAWAGKPVMGIMLNGSQGDDDETHGGHFSLFTGHFGPNGEMADWMFVNFYDMDVVSEKGILPSLVPMDKYMADLNSGQSYYRPTDVLVAILQDERPAEALEQRFEDLYAKYYAHEVLYNRTTKSCAGLVVDELRGEGWNFPNRGKSNLFSTALLSGAMAAGGHSLKTGLALRKMMRQEKTRLFPRAAFEAMTMDLLALGGDRGKAPKRDLTPFERELQTDLDAVMLVRLPQFPSSRAYGSYPVASVEEYFRRVPMSRSKWKTVPTQPRSYPPPH